MIKSIGWLTIWSEDYKKLANWYRDTLELKVASELNLPNDTGVIFEFPNGTNLWIGYHDKVRGKSKDPYRSFVSFNVDSVTELYEKLSPKGVEFIRKPSISPTPFCM